jgi:Uncharacterized conserved protein (DUF2163)
MRTLTGGMSSALTAQGSFLGWLAEIATGTGTYIRRTTMDVPFVYSGNTFDAGNLVVGNMTWDGGVNRPASMTLGDADLAIWSLVLNLQLADAPVRLWQVYASASGEAAALWSGRVGKCSRAGLTVQIELANDSATTQSPRLRVQQLVNAAFLIPAGTGIQIGSVRWIIDRQ